MLDTTTDTPTMRVVLSDPKLRRAIVSCAVGQVFEIFDFVVYGYMAVAISRAFFPAGNGVAALLGTFATFAIGFVARPVGAVVIGAYGDRHGRRTALVVTIGLMAVSTGLIGLIPGYATIGIGAPILLVICRLLQGFSTGGEWGGAAAFLVEYAPDSRRGLISSFQQAATALGLLIATLSATLLTTVLSEQSFFAWGWRLPFLLGFVLGPIGHYLRTHVAETPAFERKERQHATSRAPLAEALRDQPGALLAAFAVSIVGCVVNYVFLVYLPTYATHELHFTPQQSFVSVTICGFVYLLLTPVVGWFSDKAGRKVPMMASAVLAIVAPYPLFSVLVSVHSFAALVLMQAAATIILVLYCGTICAILAEMFPTRIRFTALSSSYGLSVAIFGGFAPLISQWLIGATGHNPIAPAYYVMLGGVLSFIGLLFVRERARQPLLD